MDVSFNGVSKIIKIRSGVTSITVQYIYSAWKAWCLQSDNMQFLQAFRYVGGDPTVNGQRLGTTFFIINGWRIEPFSGDHNLSVDGNIFTEEGGSPFIKPSGNYNILITNQFSNLSTVMEVNSNGGASSGTPTEIALAVWNTNVQSTPFDQSGTIGNYIRDKVLSVKKFIGLY